MAPVTPPLGSEVREAHKARLIAARWRGLLKLWAGGYPDCARGVLYCRLALPPPPTIRNIVLLSGEVSQVVDYVPNVVIRNASFPCVHVVFGGDALLNHREDFCVGAAVVPRIIGQVGRA